MDSVLMRTDLESGLKTWGYYNTNWQGGVSVGRAHQISSFEEKSSLVTAGPGKAFVVLWLTGLAEQEGRQVRHRVLWSMSWL